MSTLDLKTLANTETISYPESYRTVIQSPNDLTDYLFKFFNSFIPVESEHLNTFTYSIGNIITLFDNNYLSVDFNKFAYNYRLFSSDGTYINKPAWNLIFDASIVEESFTENNDSLIESRLINLNKISEIHAFLMRLKEKDSVENEIAGMKDIFLKVDELIDANDVSSVDDLIISFLGLDFSFQFHISLLASTLKVKPFLNSRTTLFNSAVSLGVTLMTREEVDLTLLGLD